MFFGHAQRKKGCCRRSAAVARFSVSTCVDSARKSLKEGDQLSGSRREGEPWVAIMNRAYKKETE